MSTFWSKKTVRRKDDGAAAYAKARNLILYVGHINLTAEENIVALKAFLESFSLAYEPEFSETTMTEAQLESSLSSTKFKYSVVLNVPAFDVTEAIHNNTQYYVFENLTKRVYVTEDNKMTRDGNVIRVLLSNLMYNGRYNSIPKEINSFKQLSKYALQGSIAEVSREIDVDMGFFEDKSGNLYPKAFKIKFDFFLWDKYTRTVKQDGANAEQEVDWYTFRSLQANTAGTSLLDLRRAPGAARDTRNWPFGFNTNRQNVKEGGLRGGMGMDPAVRQYLINKPMSKFHIGFPWKSTKVISSVWFPCFLESIGQSWGAESEDTYSTGASNYKVLTRTKWKRREITFSVPFYSDREGWCNMEKIALLYRYLLKAGGPERPGNYIYVRFSHFIKGINKDFANGSARCMVRSFSVDFDLGMGFHELRNNFIVPKAIKLSFDLEILTPDVGLNTADPF